MMKIHRYPATDIYSEKVKPLVSDSFFASRGFINLWQAVGGKGVYWVAEEDNNVLAVLPGIEFGMKPLMRFQSMPDGCYGRLFFASETNIDKRMIACCVMEALSKAGYTKTIINDYYHSIESNNKFIEKVCLTSTVDISHNEWLPPDKKMQSEIRKAERKQIKIHKFDVSLHFTKFIPLMKQTEKRHRRQPKYTVTFFKALAELAKEDSRVLWYWCEHDNQPVTTHINFIDGEMVLNWQVYFDKAFSFLKANQYILFSMAKELSCKGIKYLNLGASPIDAAGLIAYKEKWGAQPYHYTCYSRKSFIGKLL